MKVEWWRAGEVDNWDFKTKMNRVGCRPLRRKLLSCKMSNDSSEDYGEFKVSISLQLTYFLQKVKEELEECYKTLHYLQTAQAREAVN